MSLQEMIRRGTKIKLNIQQFAETTDTDPKPETKTDPESEGDPEPPAEPTVSKAAFDKVAKELAEIKKKYRANLDETARQRDEREEAEKATRALKLENALLKNGFSVDEIESLRDSVADVDVEGIVSGFGAVIAARLKAKDDEIAALKLESVKRPPTPAGEGGLEVDKITAKDFAKMNYQQRLELKEKHPDVYKKFTGGK
ncbi:hypothetical protein [Holdemania sp. Marseille-P2844]|uniref:hypothetical protein n=1 Tax=Holdemania sp. Marseille-P2844 TaxID=1852366 RepID=UPI0009333BFB|nr:hypothetical protein [Holdemania sp. Marseille-P2844]